MTGRLIRASLLIFVAAVALGLNLDKAAQIRAALIFTAIAAVLFILRKYEYFQIRKFVIVSLVIVAIAFVRISFVPQNKSLQPEFEAKVWADTVPSAYGSITTVKVKDYGHLKILGSRYPEFKSGDTVLVKIKDADKYPGYATGSLSLVDSKSPGVVLKSLVSVKRLFVLGLSKSMTEPQASFTAGTIIGGSASLPTEIKENFRNTGTSHILAASGYNFYILMLFFAYVLSPFSFSKRTTGMLLVIPAFAIIAGASAPVLRAAIMAGFLSVASFVGRINSARTAVLWAAAILVAFTPQIIKFDLGFQLSFLATLGLILAVPIFEKVFDEQLDYSPSFKAQVKTALWGAIFVTVSAQIMTMPLLAYNFGTLSIASLPANLLVFAAIPLIMFFGILTSFAGLIIQPLGQVMGILPTFLSNYVFIVTKKFASFSYSQLFAELSLMQTIVMYALILVVIFYLHRRLLTHKHEIKARTQI